MKKTFISASLLILPWHFLNAQDSKTIRIPVIFHVIYSNTTHQVNLDGRNTDENISTEKLLAELKDLHDDFLLLNNDTGLILNEFKAIVGNPNIEFYLADTVLQQNGDKGIIRVQKNANKHDLHKKSHIINPKKYLNVYIGNIGPDGFTLSSKGSEVSDPWTFPDDDAIHLSYKWIGLHYRLLTHEAGHWLGLWHLYEGGCKDDDDVSDTPPQKSATDGDCLKCPPQIKEQGCEAGRHTNYNNYMDYSGCRKMFTKEQARKMRDIIRRFRPSLL